VTVEQLDEDKEKAKRMRRMAELLKSGAKMLDLTCPQCGTPLFQLSSGEIYCANCDKRVIVLKEGEREGAVVKPLLWEDLEDTLLVKLKELNTRMRREEDADELQRLVRLVFSLLETFESLKKAKAG
jgi:UPF0148 protein